MNYRTTSLKFILSADLFERRACENTASLQSKPITPASCSNPSKPLQASDPAPSGPYPKPALQHCSPGLQSRVAALQHFFGGSQSAATGRLRPAQPGKLCGRQSAASGRHGLPQALGGDAKSMRFCSSIHDAPNPTKYAHFILKMIQMCAKSVPNVFQK